MNLGSCAQQRRSAFPSAQPVQMCRHWGLALSFAGTELVCGLRKLVFSSL